MPAVMVIALGLTIAGILAMFLVWRELDRMDRFWDEMDEWGRRRGGDAIHGRYQSEP